MSKPITILTVTVDGPLFTWRANTPETNMWPADKVKAICQSIRGAASAIQGQWGSESSKRLRRNLAAKKRATKTK